MNDWKYSRRNGLCSACTRAFAEQEQLYSLLRMHEGVLVREDRCPACFGAALAAEFESSGGLAYWRTRFAPGGGLRLDLDSLEALFLTLVGRAPPADGAAPDARVGELCYLLGLLLLRKRRLKLDRIAPARGDEREKLVVHRPRRPQQYEVAVYDLTPERQAELRDELKRIFEGAELVQLLEGAAHGSGASAEAAASDA
ncbi:MAG: hypothetical protein EPO68_14380 [Planctomycetota bacterium]|nr:MAG: hypothetical protein EPO68_14380 [Planctomycetota bacterium]